MITVKRTFGSRQLAAAADTPEVVEPRVESAETHIHVEPVPTIEEGRLLNELVLETEPAVEVVEPDVPAKTDVEHRGPAQSLLLLQKPDLRQVVAHSKVAEGIESHRTELIDPLLLEQLRPSKQEIILALDSTEPGRSQQAEAEEESCVSRTGERRESHDQSHQ